MDEFLDHWQSTLQPTALALVQNKLMWKLFFRLKEPNKQAVAAIWIGKTVGYSRAQDSTLDMMSTLGTAMSILGS